MFCFEIVDHPVKRIPLDEDHLIERYLAGESELSIANRLGVSRPVIVRRLEQAGVERRNRAAAMKQRMANSSPEQRAAWAAAAHDAVRGSVQPEEKLARAALTRQRNATFGSYLEEQFAMMLTERGVEFVLQHAIGRYNADFTTGPIAVEIYGGKWHFSGNHLERAERRLRKFADEGWHVLAIIASTDYPLLPESADYLVGWLEQAKADPSAPREYRVVRGAGELVSAQRLDADEITVIHPRAGARDVTTGRYYSVER